MFAMINDMNERYLTVKQMAEILNVSTQSIRRSLRSGRLHGIRITGDKKAHYRIPASEIERMHTMSFEDALPSIKAYIEEKKL